MAEARISSDQEPFKCPVCLNLLKDPVTLHCGHNYCKACINRFWDHQDVRRVYSCPQCRETFTPRPVLCRNNVLAEMVEKQNKAKLQTASLAGPGDVECDSCIGRKRKAVNSCLVCKTSYCEDHVKPHYQSPAFKKHKLVEACADLQEKICSQHDKPIEIYCRTDQRFICYLCMMDDHKGHDTVSAKTERNKKQNELKEEQMKSQQRIQEKQKEAKELNKAVDIIKMRSQAAVDENEKIFTELISFMEKKRSEVTELIRAQEKAELSRAERLLKQLEQEIADLKRRVTELEQLSHTHDHIHFLQSFPSLCVSPGCEDSLYTVNLHHTFDGIRESFLQMKVQVEQIRPQAAALFQILPSQLTSRQNFLQYFRFLTLDPNTAHPDLLLSEKNRSVTYGETQQYSDHPERFDFWPQVLCKESVCGHCYWEVEWSGTVYISVSYKEISRKGGVDECWFGCNSQSWSLVCSPAYVTFSHNNVNIQIRGPASSRIGVYVDHGAGTLSFYSISDTISLLHTVHTTFTQPLYAGFWVFGNNSTVRLCDSN
ncbi:tripartite motif-containing protein 16-like [Clarias gariepinus]|uniref:tripartite motif-containing protein 16-like n=1 Tax=Clarias gariepinus TaxID=13013 RepID=UPI00234D9B01|nr:tripartite motif-containing protein 16-like [Clarias gariepinus]